MSAPGRDRRPASSAAAAAGAQIQRRRQQRGMSQAELARRTGLSKATLSQLEAGLGNPTLDTLDAIAVALAIPLTDLLIRHGDPATVHLASTAARESEPTRELLRRISGGHSLEIWRLRLPPDTAVDGVPHAPGTTEHLLVASGSLFAGPADDLRHLRPGDMLAFAGDAAHRYSTGDTPADVTVVIASPVAG
ncbi:Transcriptional regulator [[Actinomadura] parvosata subsp. kistnae]|uniref:Transcriptional regulator n=1 Tax=[Actinomadura] parvosata subsp. kistnae TaxID=1909395 RepID=A0A1U9ZU64_9ACTN|nr:helix-turn-helix domain-containing protein [Nonomuraea sp. ATCC 55076]AQZ61501.1 transcriptional regulator [Nonomuraea sp. ATCC 55076]SPL98211.1 Transcriptional regulator [Actinomadura parvosata subsp. kistnae]